MKLGGELYKAGLEGDCMDKADIQRPHMFTVAIPAYNVEAYLVECLESVRVQTLQDFDILIVDDGSTDKTSELCDAYSAMMPECKVYHKKNEGPLLARCDLIKLAAGQYVYFLDADDMLHPRALECMSDAIQQFRPDILNTGYSEQEDYGHPRQIPGLVSGLMQGSKYAVVKEAACRGSVNAMCSKVFRREILDSVIDYREYAGLKYGEDLLQILPVIDRAHSMYYSPEPLYFYRQRADASTARYSTEQLRDIEKVLPVLMEYGRRWDMEELAYKGALFQYIGLLRMLEQDRNIAFSQKGKQYDVIRKSLREFIKNHDDVLPLRFDHRWLINQVIAGKYGRVNAMLALERIMYAG